jgi:hypothetical protein
MYLGVIFVTMFRAPLLSIALANLALAFVGLASLAKMSFLLPVEIIAAIFCGAAALWAESNRTKGASGRTGPQRQSRRSIGMAK